MAQPLDTCLFGNQAPGCYIETNFPGFVPRRTDSLIEDEVFLENYISGSDLFANCVSCNGIAIEMNNGVTGQQCDRSSSKDPKRTKWTDKDDRLLIKLVKQYGEKNWSPICMHFAEKTGKQCRERWFNILHPDIKKDLWNQEEDVILIIAHRMFGNNWGDISKYIPGRPGNTIKNRFNSIKRKLNSKRRNNGRNSRTRDEYTLLEQYIISTDANNHTKGLVLARSRDSHLATSEDESIQVQQKASPAELSSLQSSLGVQSYDMISASGPHYNQAMIIDAGFGANGYPDSYDQYLFEWQSSPTMEFHAENDYGYNGIDRMNMSNHSISETFQSSSLDEQDNS